MPVIKLSDTVTTVCHLAAYKYSLTECSQELGQKGVIISLFPERNLKSVRLNDMPKVTQLQSEFGSKVSYQRLWAINTIQAQLLLIDKKS